MKYIKFFCKAKYHVSAMSAAVPRPLIVPVVGRFLTMGSLKRIAARLAEWILTRLSKDRHLPSGGASAEDPLLVLRREYHNLRELVAGKTVLDFGCGYGEQSVALTTAYGCKVTGLDTNPRVLGEAQAKHGNIARFILEPDGQRYEVVISQNSMEHFPDPKAALDTMVNALAPGGIILLSFGCPWFSPYGSHMHFFCALPWVNLLFPESVVMKVRAKYWQDGATRYEEVEGGLNKMTVAKFERLLRRPDVKVERRQYTAVKHLPLVTAIPVIRELLTNHLSVVIRKVSP